MCDFLCNYSNVSFFFLQNEMFPPGSFSVHHTSKLSSVYIKTWPQSHQSLCVNTRIAPPFTSRRRLSKHWHQLLAHLFLVPAPPPRSSIFEQAITGKDPVWSSQTRSKHNRSLGVGPIYFPPLIDFPPPFLPRSAMKQNLHLNVISYPNQFVFASEGTSHR